MHQESAFRLQHLLQSPCPLFLFPNPLSTRTLPMTETSCLELPFSSPTSPSIPLSPPWFSTGDQAHPCAAASGTTVVLSGNRYRLLFRFVRLFLSMKGMGGCRGMRGIGIPGQLPLILEISPDLLTFVWLLESHVVRPNGVGSKKPLKKSLPAGWLRLSWQGRPNRCGTEIPERAPRGQDIHTFLAYPNLPPRYATAFPRLGGLQ